MIQNIFCDQILFHILDMTDPYDTWQCLKNMYADSSEPRRQLLQDHLCSLRLVKGQPIDMHLAAINGLVTQLRNCVDTLTNAQLVNAVLSSLPASWDNFSTAICLKDTQPKYPKLQTMLQQEELNREQHQKRKDVPTEAIITVATHEHSDRSRNDQCRSDSRSDSRNNNNDRRSNCCDNRHNTDHSRSSEHSQPHDGNCHTCGMPGHWSKDFPTN
jgi:hypothetical protein